MAMPVAANRMWNASDSAIIERAARRLLIANGRMRGTRDRFERRGGMVGVHGAATS
jgi:hypothetical protein